MRVYDEVKLKDELPELAEKGIHQGCDSDVIAVDGDMCKVIFFAPRIYGDYAVVQVEQNALTYISHMSASRIEIIKEAVSAMDESKHTRFLDVDVYEYDEVEVIVDKEKYAKHGVHKGMTGTVIADYSIRNKWLIEFSDEESGEDIAILEVHREDFKVIKRSHIQVQETIESIQQKNRPI